MISPNFTILYVDDPAKSAAFYSSLFGTEPIEASPSFALFSLSGGNMLGLWSRHTVEPPTAAEGGAVEIAFSVDDASAVRTMHREWSARGLTIIQEPTNLDFGFTFVALDPDKHRLRVFHPTE